MRIFFRTILCSFCFFCVRFPVFSQDVRSKVAAGDPVFNLRTSLNSWFDYDAGLMIGIGYRWSRNFSASFEPTWIFYRGYSTDDGGRSNEYPIGLKIRADLKYFPFKRKNDDFGFFLAPEFHLKLVRTKMFGSFGINCVNGQCAYFQNAWFTEKKNEIGGLLKIGTIFPLLRMDKRWLIELYGGLGLKTRTFRHSDIPVGGSAPVRGRSLWFPVDPEDAVPLLPAGVKLLFLLEKRD